MKTPTINPAFQALIPPLQPEELDQLEANLLADGCRDPLVTWKGVLVDGHNRMAICQKHGKFFEVVEKSFRDEDEVKVWIIRNQFGRRNLTPYCRAELALKLEPLLKSNAKENIVEGGRLGGKSEGKGLTTLSKAFDPVNTRAELATASGVSHDTIAKVKIIEAHASEATKDKLRKGETTINREAKEINREIKRAAFEVKVASAKSAPRSQLITGPFDLILADPPWRYEHCEADNREIENQYQTATIDEISKHKKHLNPKQDCILFLWATAPKLSEAMTVMERWGFNYRSCAVWDKQVIGMGYWWRIQHELLLVGVMGKPSCTPEPARISSIFSERRGTHSTKPQCVYQWIERAFPDSVKLEMYCRQPRQGWAAWGNEC